MDYNRSSGGGGKKFGGRSGGGRPSFGGGGRDRGERPTMHKATCSECGNGCEVPFRPSGDKPVFCNNCFKREDRDGGSDRGRGNDFGKRSFGRDSDRERPEMHHAVCNECGEDCEVPFKPSGDKPVFCSNCFKKDGGGRGGNNSEQFKAEFEALNAKLDKILKMMTPVIKVSKADKVEVFDAEFDASEEVKKPKAKKASKKAAKVTDQEL